MAAIVALTAALFVGAATADVRAGGGGLLAAATPTPTATLSAVGSAYSPVVPCRLFDSRDGGTKVQTNQTVTIQVSGRCGTPAGATAAAVTLTVTSAEQRGYLTAWQGGGITAPTSSNLNWLPGDTRANGGIIPLAADGTLAIRVSSATHVIVDVGGVFSPTGTTSAGRFVAAAPSRILDTRTSGIAAADTTTLVPLPVGVPADATAVAATVTLVQATGPGFVAVFPAGGDRPNASTVNSSAAGQTRAAGAVLPISPSGLAVYASRDAHVLIDIGGYFTGPSAAASHTGLFVPITPTRLLDTRTGEMLYTSGSMALDYTTVTGTTAAAVVGNWTSTEATGHGYLSAWPSRTTLPTASVTNYRPGDTAASMSITATSAAGVSLYASVSTHTVADIFGYFTGTPIADPSPPQHVEANVRPGVPVDTFGPLTSPNAGSYCAAGATAASTTPTAAGLSRFFAGAIGPIIGSDYQRPYRLPDGRVLWLLQDAFIGSTEYLAHNIGLIQSGRCFSILQGGSGSQSWLMRDRTIDKKVWYWAAGAKVTADGRTLQIVMNEMRGSGAAWHLADVTMTAQYIVDVRLSDFAVSATRPAWSSPAGFGWTITSDSTHTYLYSWCYRQFPIHGACTQHVMLARLPVTARLESNLEYWNGTGWSATGTAAVPIVHFYVTGATVNPIDVKWDGAKFLAITKPGDWLGMPWGGGHRVQVFTAPSAQGPWTKVYDIPVAAKCDPAVCNTYWASWVPWRDPVTGLMIWQISNNVWSGLNMTIYRPSTYSLPRP